MATKKERILWQGHPVRDEKHRNDLDMKAAIFQFHHGMDRTAAEHRVKHEDRVERHQQAAAHHLDGMRAAYAVGNHEDAQQHHAMYSLHVKALGQDPAGAVPKDVAHWQGDKEKKHAYTFKGHGDDQFLVQPVRDTPPPQAGLAKAEGSMPDSTCENCGNKRSPIEVQNDYCSGCAKEIDEAGKQAQANMNWGEPEGHKPLLDALRNAGTPEAIGGAKDKLLSYLKGIGIEGASIEAPPAPIPQKPPLRVFEGTKTPTAPKYGHLRIVKAEAWPSILGCWRNLAKADGGEAAQGRVKQFDVRKTWLRHRHTPEEQAFDYSSWLTPEQNQNGYRMFVLSHGPGNPVRAHVVHNGQKAGSAHGNVDQGDLEVENYSLAGGAHHNRGLEASMLNAMMGHAKSRMGANYLSHGPFTPEASGFIEAVAKPHGFELGEPEDIEDGETPADQQPGRLVTGGVKVRSQQPQRVPRSFSPRVPQWWRTSAEEND